VRAEVALPPYLYGHGGGLASTALSRCTEGTVMRVERQTVDLSAYPDLVVIYLGMRVRRPRGLAYLLGLGPQIQKSWKAQPDGLLLHEDLIWSLVPPHLGMRQYWRDLESLERWTRSEPHRRWWQQFLKNSGGTGFWHETYFMGGGVEAIYDDMASPTGLARFAPAQPARGAMFSARHRAGRVGALTAAPVIPETVYYGPTGAADVGAPDTNAPD
jgi:Monooxygenase af470-like